MSQSLEALPSDETVPSEPKTKVCPRCRTSWPEANAPLLCPTDGVSLVRPRDLEDPNGDAMVGRTLEGRYTILAKLGAGSMGTVYRARQHTIGRDVAIKILRGDRAIDETARARFMREARANSVLASPNTVTVFDFGQSESGEFYLAMELLEGESLGERLARVGRLTAPVAVDACRQALRSLGEAHAKGIIHRDLKPDNLFFARMLTSTRTGSTKGTEARTHEEIVKVLDFGIAKMIDADGPMGVVETQAGTVFGTPRYMSPEQAQGKPLDARSDLYSLAVILYQMLTGRPPFTDNDAVVVMARHIKSVPKRPNEVVPEAMVPVELEDVLMRTLSKDPADRPPNAEALAGELLAALDGVSAQTSGVRSAVTNAAGIRLPGALRPAIIALPKSKKRTAASVIVALGLITVLGGVYLSSRDAQETPEARITSAVPDGGPIVKAPPARTATAVAAEPPIVTPESLPQAPLSTPKSSRIARPAAKGAPPPIASSQPSQETPRYGIFE